MVVQILGSTRRCLGRIATQTYTSTDIRKAYHDQHSNQVLGHFGGGYDYRFKHSGPHAITLYPFANLDYLYVMQSSYTERGAHSLDLKVHETNSDLLRPEVGLGFRCARCFPTVDIALDVSASYVHEFRFKGKHTKAGFKDSSCQFTVVGLLPNNNLFCPTTRLILSTPDTYISLSLGYHGEFGPRFSENAGDAEVRFSF